MIKTITKLGIGVALIFVMYQEVLVWNQVAEIKEAVVQTNTIVKEIILLSNTPYSLENDYHCLASNIYWEARNQPLLGKLAVAQVTQNRVNSKKFPNSICGVITQTRFYPSGRIDLHSCQFSWYCDGKKDEPLQHEYISYERSFELAVNFIEERPIDVTEGSTHYHNYRVEPYWITDLEKVVQIEEHIFYR